MRAPQTCTRCRLASLLSKRQVARPDALPYPPARLVIRPGGSTCSGALKAP